jgi:hypothetical protein
MLEFDDNNVIKIENYLNKNKYTLNSNEISVFHNPIYYYYKSPIVVIFYKTNITIKDFKNNRKFQFDFTSSNEIIINFLKYLEKDVILA